MTPALVALAVAAAACDFKGELVDQGRSQPDASPFVAADARPDAFSPPDAVVEDAGGADAPSCSEGDARVVDAATGTCYMFFTTQVTWAAARANCEGLGGGAHLATSSNQQENDLILGVGGTSIDVWMGGTDQATEASWVWLTAEAMTFLKWREGEPNDGLDGEDCMIMEVDNVGFWDDRSCANAYPYFCERPGS